MNRLAVICCAWGERWPLGTLADNGSALLFEYTPEALRRGIQFSPRFLPLQATAFGDLPRHQQRLPGLFADALPDGWGQLMMDKLFRKQGWAPTRLSPLDRLAFIGERAVGAFSFEPAETPDWPDCPLSLQELAHAAQAAQAPSGGKDATMLTLLAMLGGSPLGSRPKLLMQYDAGSGQLSARPDAAGTPWSLKLPARGEHKELCAVEDVYATLARACGLAMPATRHFELDRRIAAFGAERCDREHGMRVPVHTLAGLLHTDFRSAALDYSILLRATRLMTRDESQVRAAFERCVFNVVFHNRDDHARSVAFRMNQRWEWQLAPCHDLSFSHGPGGVHQMAVMGESVAPGADDLLRLAADAALPPAWARRSMERIAGHGADFERLARAAPVRAATVKAIARAIAANCARMR
ncbi:MAG: type II toxin-antitoxin system HipA family toxin [Sphingomonadaceae bacterium]